MKIFGLVNTLILIILLSLVGCGRKGGLVLPAAQMPPQQEAVTTLPAQQDTQDTQEGTQQDINKDKSKDTAKDSQLQKENTVTDPLSTE